MPKKVFFIFVLFFILGGVHFSKTSQNSIFSSKQSSTPSFLENPTQANITKKPIISPLNILQNPISLPSVYRNLSYSMGGNSFYGNSSDLEWIGGNSLDFAFSTSGLDDTNQTMGLKGDYVKIGIIEYEGYPSKKLFPSLKDTRIIYDFENGQKKIGDYNYHASLITSILAGDDGVVPNATIYATSVTNGSSFYEKLDWLVKNNVDVINFSGYVNSKLDGKYGEISKWIDHIAVKHNITFVHAAGNAYQKPIFTSSLAYNAIIVGALDTNETADPKDDSLFKFSSYNESADAPLKPDIVAPGRVSLNENLKGLGTSISSPLVTGAISSMIDYDENLSGNSELQKAILAASAFRTTANDYGVYKDSPFISNKEGAGVLNAQQAINWILNKKRYLASSIDYSKTYFLKLPVNEGEVYRVAMAWNKIVKGSYTLPGEIIKEYPLVDLDLYIIDERGKIIAKSVSSSNNLELIKFKALTTGTYRIVVKPIKQSYLKSGSVALAWW